MTDKENINNCTKRECNVLSSFLNPTKCTKSKTIHCSPILQVYMKTLSGGAKFIFLPFWILEAAQRVWWVSWRQNFKISSEITWETQAGKFTTSKKVNVDFCQPEFISKNTVTWKCHVDESTNGRYDMILGRYIRTAVILDLKFSENVILGREGLCGGCSTPMADVSN